MAIFADKNTRLLVQGMTGREGLFHTQQMIAYGTKVVGGVTPGKGGEWVEGVPVFETVKEAKNATGANATISFVPPKGAVDGLYEAIDAELDLIVCITENIPISEMMKVRQHLDLSGKSRLIGPNCPGLLIPGQTKIGIMPGYIATPGNVGVVSRSGTLTYEVVQALTNRGIGQSACIGIGGDPVNGTGFLDVLQLFEEDPETDKVVMIGEIGGDGEERAAQFVRERMTKPVVAFVAGKAAPPGRRMGHAGALVEGNVGTWQGKVDALRAANVKVAENPEQIPDLL
jgi:succinyl-CoA synthetase alpha subunit